MTRSSFLSRSLLVLLAVFAQKALASDVYLWVLNPDECGAVFRPKLAQDRDYWKLLDLRNRYRRLLSDHLAERGLPLNRRSNFLISRYLNSVLPLSSEASIQWRRAESTKYDYALPYTGVFNPIAGRIEWKLAERNGDRDATPYAGVFNPVRNIVEWRRAEVSPAGLNAFGNLSFPHTGVFNPLTGEVEWQKAKSIGIRNPIALPYAGAFNPVTGQVEWKVAEPSIDSDILGRFALPYAGVFNPVTGLVEWRQAESYGDLYALTYSGVYDPHSERVEWRKADPHGADHALPYTGVLTPFQLKAEDP